MRQQAVKYNLITILGPTAVGKTSFAAHLAKLINGEIISADSRQVYKRMDLGTGKDYSDYVIDGTNVPCHLIDIREPGQKYSVFEYQQDFLNVFTGLVKQGKMPVLCGGTGMYIDAVTRGYQLIPVPPDHELRARLEKKSLKELTDILNSCKSLHNKTDTDTKKRAIRAIEIAKYYQEHPEVPYDYPDIRPLFIGIRSDRETRRRRITERLQQRLQEGMIDEVENLLKEGISPDDLLYYGLEYKYITEYITGKRSYDNMVTQLNTAIHRFAKRQMTWFRKMEKEGADINWINAEWPMEKKLEMALELI